MPLISSYLFLTDPAPFSNSLQLDRHLALVKFKIAYEKITADIAAKDIRRRELERFIQSIEKLPEMVTEFDEALWGSLVDHLTVNAKDDIVFTLTSGMEIKT